MTTRRVLSMILGAVGTVGVLALLFGNQWFNRWMAESEWGNERDALGFLLSWLRFPAWRIADGTDAGVQVSLDAGFLLLFVFLAGLIALGARSLDPVRGGFGALMTGWWATTVAAFLAALVRSVLLTSTEDFSGLPASNIIPVELANGALFGLVYGWLPGLATLLAFLVTRPGAGVPRSASAYPSVPPQAPPSGHPAARPYVVQGQQPPPPPGWAPPPPSPGAVPTGGFPLPETPPAGYAPPVVHQPPPPPAQPDGLAAAQPTTPPAGDPPPAAPPADARPAASSAGDPPAADLPADDPPADAPPAENPSADALPADDLPADVRPAASSGGDPSADAPPAADLPADDLSADDDRPAADLSSEARPAGPSAAGLPVDDPPSDDRPAGDPPSGGGPEGEAQGERPLVPPS